MACRKPAENPHYHDSRSVSFLTNLSPQPESSIAVLSDGRPDRSYKDQSRTTLVRSSLPSADRYHPYEGHPHHQIKSRKPFDRTKSRVGPARKGPWQAEETFNLAETDRYAPRSQTDCYRPIYSSNVKPRGQWGPSQVTYNQLPRGQWGPWKSGAIKPTQQDPKLTERQKRNFKIFPRICNPYFPEVNERHVKPFVLQLNRHPENPFIIRPANLSSHRLVATNNTGSETLFFLEFHPLNTTDPTQTKVVTKLGEIISNLYFMGNNRQDIHPCTMNTGIMRGVGFRPGSDRGSTAGTYARRSNLSQQILDHDDYCWDQLGDHNQFLCNRVRHFSKQSFKDNAQIIESFGIPSWSNSEWNDFEQENNGIFSSAITTHSDFSNEPHMDQDSNPWTYGLFSYINRSTGKPVLPPSSVPGHAFRFPDFNCQIDFGTSPGIIELLWASNSVKHQTLHPPPSLKSTAEITHSGSSFQICKRLVDRAIKLKEKSAEERAKKTLCREKRQVIEAERAQKKK
ncbi:Ubiquitin carboxyl-terminal hydrolase 7, variant 2 [Puccinia graminis f. sp. tritici]|nr:Ubiquitin carboxyl-terminal hydrolase 7, variant 2 [Puccinia graminis f. sp. tritici]KAA1100315.1 Ubiquitin carboxyl-terminal hydrolase 7, variant 2 [Puccinia graminis f. sp. tritici]